jgi:uncharacterized YigZ family protein
MQQTVRSRYSQEYRIKKSRFIGVLMPCRNEMEVKNCLQECQLSFPDASHITFAYRIKTSNGFINRFHDSGEPAGTAGKPIFQHLDGKDLVNTLLVVIRYFGGIKLGAGGLTRSYSHTAKLVIENAELFPYVEFITQMVVLDYKQLQQFEYDLTRWDGEVTGQDFAEQIRLTITLPEQNLIEFKNLYSGLICE